MFSAFLETNNFSNSATISAVIGVIGSQVKLTEYNTGLISAQCPHHDGNNSFSTVIYS